MEKSTYELINKLYIKFLERSKTHHDNRRPYSKRHEIDIKDDIIHLSQALKSTYPFYSTELFAVKDKLIGNNGYFEASSFSIVFTILKSLKYDIDNGSDLGFWMYVHPNITEVCKKLFLDKHYNKSVLAAYIEIEVRLKAIRKKLRPQEKELIGAKLMEAIFSDNDPILLQFQSRENEDGHNVQKGFMQIFAGAMTGIRNLPAHGNTDISKDDAVRKLMLASLLMYKVDEAIAFTGISE